MRQLATIQRIKNLQCIEGKDKIEFATVLGWQVIVQKDQFQVGDFCIYIEIDSILPEKPEFEFLRPRCYSSKWNGFRIKTMKMGNTYSQGICFPVILFPEIFNNCFNEGMDITEKLGIVKYDPELKKELEFKNKKARLNPIFNFLIKILPFLKFFLKNKNKYNTAPFPSFIHKTDETRIQAFPYILKDYEGLLCYITEKLDGQSASFLIYKNKFYVCSRNLQLLKFDNSNYWNIAKQLEIEKKLKELGKNICIQGEIIGTGIQDNKYKLDHKDFYIFQAFDIDNQKYFTFEELKELSCKIKLPMVPLLKVNAILKNDLQYYISLATDNSVLSTYTNDSILMEGIVVRSMDNKPYGLKGMGNIFSFKVINPEFLIKYESRE